jgi:Ni/Fe-hydrogenase subunit HybB-like protein
MVIFEGSISHKVFRHRLSDKQHASHDDILLGLGRVCAVVMFAYFFLKVLVLAHNQQWSLLGTRMGWWYLVEVLGFVLVPGLLYFVAVRDRRLRLIRVAAILTLVGIILNRLNISVIAFKWDSAAHYVPSWMEVEVTLAVICAEIWVFRWVINRLPVLGDPPRWAAEHSADQH